jgi:hypothetical protein
MKHKLTLVLWSDQPLDMNDVHGMVEYAPKNTTRIVRGDGGPVQDAEADPDWGDEESLLLDVNDQLEDHPSSGPAGSSLRSTEFPPSEDDESDDEEDDDEDDDDDDEDDDDYFDDTGSDDDDDDDLMDEDDEEEDWDDDD